MGKVYSNYFKKEFELLTIEKQEGDHVMQILTHEGLEDLVHNVIPTEEGVTYDFRFENTDVNHSVVVCVVADKTGRRIVDVGESIPATLDTDIAKSYPTLMAKQRAFDRAVIRFFAFPGKTYSNTEIPVNEPQQTNQIKESATGIQSASVEDKKEEDTPKEAPIQKQETPREQPSQTQTTTQESAQDAGNPGEVMMKAGSKKFKMTVAQVFASDVSAVAWVRKNIKPSKPEYKETLDAIEAYMAANGSAREVYEKYTNEHPEFKVA